MPSVFFRFGISSGTTVVSGDSVTPKPKKLPKRSAQRTNSSFVRWFVRSSMGPHGQTHTTRRLRGSTSREAHSHSVHRRGTYTRGPMKGHPPVARGHGAAAQAHPRTRARRGPGRQSLKRVLRRRAACSSPPCPLAPPIGSGNALLRLPLACTPPPRRRSSATHATHTSKSQPVAHLKNHARTGSQLRHRPSQRTVLRCSSLSNPHPRRKRSPCPRSHRGRSAPGTSPASAAAPAPALNFPRQSYELVKTCIDYSGIMNSHVQQTISMP